MAETPTPRVVPAGWHLVQSQDLGLMASWTDEPAYGYEEGKFILLHANQAAGEDTWWLSRVIGPQELRTVARWHEQKEAPLEAATEKILRLLGSPEVAKPAPVHNPIEPLPDAVTETPPTTAQTEE